MDIQMGSFNNMILVDDWMAIQYDIITTNPETGEAKPGTTINVRKITNTSKHRASPFRGWRSMYSKKGREKEADASLPKKAFQKSAVMLLCRGS